jgi:hypothetical protein
MIPSKPEFPEMIGGKMVGTVLALMIADIKRVSQHFQGFKSADMSEFKSADMSEVSQVSY